MAPALLFRICSLAFLSEISDTDYFIVDQGRALDFLSARVITMPHHLNVSQDISKTHIRFSDVNLKTPLKATFMHQVLFSDHHLQCCIRESGVYVELPKLIGKGIRFMAF